MTVDLSLLAGRVRAELVGQGHVPTPLHDLSADEAVRVVHSRGAGAVYVEAHLLMVLRNFAQPTQASGLPRDARVALGEYDTFLDLLSEAAA